ncbi:hypothetical protein DP939_25870 [Spongiactinospora rosea]|uniref:Uncharacterized protein n=1 Tax=Spongiactinospora rosea TaxID=2248750 RepID=A0A366LVZ1_9ACTN|nr:hypothetical protein DP939_25870 [Spongiactinospora rosea]
MSSLPAVQMATEPEPPPCSTVLAVISDTLSTSEPTVSRSRPAPSPAAATTCRTRLRSRGVKATTTREGGGSGKGSSSPLSRKCCGGT